MKQAAVAALVGIGLTACTFGGDAHSEAQPSAETFSPGSSWAGNFLAARHARARHDYTSSADFFLSAQDKEPTQKNLLVQSHFALLVDGRMEEAIEVAHRIQADGGPVPLAILTLAADAMRSNRVGEAEAFLSTLPETSMNGLLRSLMLAWTLFELDRPDDAMAALAPLAKNDRTKALYHLHAALLNEARPDIKAADRHYAATTPEDSSLSLRVVQLAGAFHERSGQREKAKVLYDRYEKEHPSSGLLEPENERLAAGTPPPPPLTTAADGSAEVLFSIASSLSSQNAGEMVLALSHLGLFLRPDFPALQVLAAQTMEGFGRFEDANAQYAAVAPSSSLAWHAQLGIAANLDRLDRFEEAEKVLREMSEARPGEPQPLVELGDIQRRREDFDQAVASYDAAFARLPSIEPQHWGLLYARGIALERSGQWDRAEADFLQALEFEPNQPLVLNYLGYSWIEQGKHLERALDMIRKAIELRPDDGYIVDSLGWAHYRLGNFEEAVEHLERAAELRPGDPVINDHLGDAYWVVGREREARFQWQAALSLDPEPKAQAEIEKKLKHGLVREANATTDG